MNSSENKSKPDNPSRITLFLMHGSHFLSPEYEISASRLEAPTKSCNSFGFERSKGKSESSPASKHNNWSLRKKLSTAFVTIILIIFGMIRSFGPSNMLKLYTGSQLIVAYIAPKLMKVKRGLNIGDRKLPADTVRPIIEIIPIPLHLIIALDGSDREIETVRSKDIASQIIIPTNHSFTYILLNNTEVSMNYNATSIFEALTFSLCESYLRNYRNPTKITIVGSSRAASCSLGRYRWALKIPREIISFRIVNGNKTSNFASCPKIKKDPFDCNTPNREKDRLRISQACPKLYPFLTACKDRSTLERALAHTPSWAIRPSSIKNN